MEHIKTILQKMFGIEKTKGRKIMSEEKTTKKKSYTCYVYGQIYAEYLKSGKQSIFLIQNIHVREWQRILKWLKRHQHIGDYALGDTIEDAAKLIIKGFNEENKIYEKYLKGVEKNVKNEKAA